MNISYDKIYEDTHKLIKTHGSSNPKILLEERGVYLIPFPNKTTLLGMYKIIKRNRYVFYNPYVENYMQNMVLAHELGHDMYHRKEASKKDLIEYELFDINGPMELEANIFAAHLIIDDNEIMDSVKEGYTYDQLAMQFRVNANLIIFKLNEMLRLGYPICVNFNADRKFFAKIDGTDLKYKKYNY